MRGNILLVLVALACCLCGDARRLSREDDVMDDIEKKYLSDSEFFDILSTGPDEPRKVVDDSVVVTQPLILMRREELSVDEETIRKAEKMADEDLLNGLNRILKNNETLEDVIRSENGHETFESNGILH